MHIALATSAELPRLDPDSRLLPPAFAEQGVDARPAVWTDPDVDWGAYDAVVIRSVWDYFLRPIEFRAWVDRVGSEAEVVVNPPDVVTWNAHKGYLRDLEDRGVPVVETQWLTVGERATVRHAAAIVKPAVSGAAIGLRRMAAGDLVVAETDLLVQPFLPSTLDEGELSLLYAGGDLSHAVRKVPARGDIRVQPEFGSAVTLEDPTDEALDTARAVLDAVGRDLAYARVDLVRAADGTLRLIELEVIEPQLYLRWDPSAPARFARALTGAVRRG